MLLTKYKVACAVLTGVMLGFAFPPFPTGILAAFAFVPLFLLIESTETYGEALRYSYLAFLVFNLIVLYWPGGFVHAKDPYLMIAGVLLILVHPFFFCATILGWMYLMRHFGFTTSLWLFPLLWVAFEYLHSLFEIGFPWLTLGNTQTYDLSLVQFISYTGVYGLSFWLLVMNVLAYILYVKFSTRTWKPSSLKAITLVIGLLVVYFLPKVYGNSVLQRNKYSSTENQVRIGIVQPNIDPFDKWQSPVHRQIGILQQHTYEVSKQNVDLVIWPETAIPFYIIDPQNRSFLTQLKQQVRQLNVNLLTGIPYRIFYEEGDVIPNSSKVAEDGRRYDSFNSSMLLQSSDQKIQIYSKVLLVPFAERVPFSEELSFLNAMRWNFGLGGWGIGRDTTVFRFKTRESREVSFSNLICYESIYPGFVANFVRKGAQFLTIITNDSWWGNTSGAYQHLQFALLRAVENRRWITRCANGGISCFIDPFGRILRPSKLFTQSTIVGEIFPESELTFYSQYGDWLPEIALIVCSFFFAAAIGKKLYLKIRTK